MHDLIDLQRRFTIPGVVAIESGQNDLPRVAVSTSTAEAHVYLHGAHVAHYRRVGRPPLLFMSKKSWFEAGKPIRGGVPIVFPWFGPAKDNPQFPAHGFGRLREWTLRDVRQDASGDVIISLSLGPDDATRALWPHAFELVYSVTVGPALSLSLEVRNTDSSPFTFEEALHTYLAVGDVREVTVAGLAGRACIDKMHPGVRQTQSAEPFRITAETDRIYVATPDAVTVTDPGMPGGARAITVAKAGSLTTVVWNPWVAKSKAMPDFGDDEWPGMICVETANVGEHAVTLGPGERHVMSAEVREG